MIDFLNLFTLVNIMWATSVVMIASAFSWIFALYILPFFIGMPIGLLEFFAYFLNGSLFLAASELANSSPHTFSHIFLAMLACLAVPLSYTLSIYIHCQEFAHENFEFIFKAGVWLCTVVWFMVAIYFSSQIIAIIAILALFTALGFIFLSLPFCYIIGFSSESVIPRSMSVAFYFIVLYVFVTTQNFDSNPLWNVFRPAILGLGTFIFFLSGLIISNRWYHGSLSLSTELLHYLWTNILVCVCGLLAIAFGSLFPKLSLLKSVGGTFFSFFLLEKYLEIPWNQVGFLWIMFGLGIMLYLLSWFINDHPEYVLSLEKIYSQ